MASPYRPHRSGLSELGQSREMSDACVAAAERLIPLLLAAAVKPKRDRQPGEQGYGLPLRVERVTVKGGKTKEPRAAAVVVSDRQYWPRINRGNQLLRVSYPALRDKK